MLTRLVPDALARLLLRLDETGFLVCLALFLLRSLCLSLLAGGFALVV